MKHQQTTPELACGKAVQFCNDARFAMTLYVANKKIKTDRLR